MKTRPRSLESFPAPEMARALFAEAGDALFLVDPASNAILDANPMAEKLSGLTRTELIGRDVSQQISHESDAEAWRGAAEKTSAFHGRDGYLLATARPGDLVPISLTVSRLHFTKSPPMALFVLRDRREQVQAHQRLRRAEQELQRVLTSVSDCLWSASVDSAGRWRYHYISPVIQRLSGRAVSLFLSDANAWEQLVHSEDRSAWRAFRQKLAAGESGELEYRIRKGEPPAWVRENVVVVRDAAQGTTLNGVLSDITERKRAEEERAALDRKLREAQRLESVGVLAGGIAHDFNNLLTPVIGYTSLAESDLPCDSPIQAYLRPIEQAARQAAGLCQQLLAYAGKGRFVLQPLHLGRIVEESLALLQVSVSKKAILSIRTVPKLPWVTADATQLRQVLLNLVTNASEAIGDNGGQILVAVESVRLNREQLARLHNGASLSEGEYVVLEVRDSGCGIPPQNLERIFEPFYSTKFTGRGLGLSAVLGIVRGHRGALQVSSELGRGSQFLIYLPADPGAVPPAEPISGTNPFHGEGKVLVVDDEGGVRRLAVTLLRGLGYATMEAEDGELALEIFRANPAEFRLVLLDLTMPRLGGAETFQAIQALRPDLPVILMSGFSEQELHAQFPDNAPRGFLQKPFGRKDLVACLGLVTNS